MSFLERLEAALAGRKEVAAEGSVGFVSAPPGGVLPNDGPEGVKPPLTRSKNKQTNSFLQVELTKAGTSGQPKAGQTCPGPALTKLTERVHRRGYTLLSIGPDHVRAGVDRELRLLAEKGRTGEQAMRDAIAITRAKIRNSPALAQDQPDTTRCLICGGLEDGDNPFLPFLSGAPNRPNWLHFGCHAEHVRRQSEKVDALMTAAGYGQEPKGRLHETFREPVRPPARDGGF